MSDYDAKILERACPKCGHHWTEISAESEARVFVNTQPFGTLCQHCYCQRVEDTSCLPAGIRCCKCGDIRHTGVMP